jgi:hypothetical protein
MIPVPGLVPGIHVLERERSQHVDGWDKPGYDEKGVTAQGTRLLTIVPFSVTYRPIPLIRRDVNR